MVEASSGNLPAMRYLGSHTGYSWLGQIIAWGFLPWLIALHFVQQAWFPALRGWLVVVPGFLPGAIWFAAKVLGPARVPWFYRRPGAVSISASGITWRTEMPWAGVREGQVPWESIDGIEGNYIRLWIVGQHHERVLEIPADNRRLQPPGVSEDWSLAQLLVQRHPDEYVLTDPSIRDLPLGMRRREPRERASVIEPQPLDRRREIATAVFVAIMYLAGLAQAAVGR